MRRKGNSGKRKGKHPRREKIWFIRTITNKPQMFLIIFVFLLLALSFQFSFIPFSMICFPLLFSHWKYTFFISPPETMAIIHISTMLHQPPDFFLCTVVLVHHWDLYCLSNSFIPGSCTSARNGSENWVDDLGGNLISNVFFNWLRSLTLSCLLFYFKLKVCVGVFFGFKVVSFGLVFSKNIFLIGTCLK